MKVSKVVRETVISAAALLLLTVVAGLTYTFFLGPRDGGYQGAAPQPVSQALRKPPKPADNATESASVQSLTTPAPPGANAILTARTLPTSRCTISVIYNNISSTDSGLAPKAADDYGTVTWSWGIPASTPLGKWPITITCTYNGRSAVARTDIEIAK